MEEPSKGQTKTTQLTEDHPHTPHTGLPVGGMVPPDLGGDVGRDALNGGKGRKERKGDEEGDEKRNKREGRERKSEKRCLFG
jgi:hypothetical protein